MESNIHSSNLAIKSRHSHSFVIPKVYGKKVASKKPSFVLIDKVTFKATNIFLNLLSQISKDKCPQLLNFSFSAPELAKLVLAITFTVL